jgi:hypothetical protein
MIRTEVINLFGIDVKKQVLADKLDDIEMRSQWSSSQRQSSISRVLLEA